MNTKHLEKRVTLMKRGFILSLPFSIPPLIVLGTLNHYSMFVGYIMLMVLIYGGFSLLIVNMDSSLRHRKIEEKYQSEVTLSKDDNDLLEECVFFYQQNVADPKEYIIKGLLQVIAAAPHVHGTMVKSELSKSRAKIERTMKNNDISLFEDHVSRVLFYGSVINLNTDTDGQKYVLREPSLTEM